MEGEEEQEKWGVGEEDVKYERKLGVRERGRRGRGREAGRNKERDRGTEMYLWYVQICATVSVCVTAEEGLE